MLSTVPIQSVSLTWESNFPRRHTDIRQQVEEHLKKEHEPDIPSTSAQIDADPETESWDDDNDEDDDLLPLPDEGGFQLEFICISRVINHMTCYKLSALIGWNYSIQTGEQIL